MEEMQGKREKRGGGVSTDIIRCNRIARREKINPQQTRWKFAGKIITTVLFNARGKHPLSESRPNKIRSRERMCPVVEKKKD